MTKFIETEDKDGTKFKINVSNIALIEDTDKYFRTITLSIVDEDGKFIKIKSIHSLDELNGFIQEA